MNSTEEGRLRAVSSSTTTHPDLVHLEALLLRAVNLHLHLQLQRLPPSGLSEGSNSCAHTRGDASAVHAAYVAFFREMQSFTRCVSQAVVLNCFPLVNP
jgi:hypothetical protein